MTKPTAKPRAPAEARPSGLEALLDVPLKLTVELGRARLLIQDVLSLGDGSLVELDRLVGEPLDVKIQGKLVARGEAVVVNGKLGVRILEIVAGALSRDDEGWEHAG